MAHSVTQTAGQPSVNVVNPTYCQQTRLSSPPFVSQQRAPISWAPKPWSPNRDEESRLGGKFLSGREIFQTVVDRNVRSVGRADGIKTLEYDGRDGLTEDIPNGTNELILADNYDSRNDVTIGKANVQESYATRVRREEADPKYYDHEISCNRHLDVSQQLTKEAVQRLTSPKAKLRDSWKTDARVAGDEKDEYFRPQHRQSLIGGPLHERERDSRGAKALCAEDAPDRRGRGRTKGRMEDRKRHRSVPSRNKEAEEEVEALTPRRRESMAEMKQKQLDCHQKLLQWKQRMLMAEDLKREQLMLRAWHLLSLEDGNRYANGEGGARLRNDGAGEGATNGGTEEVHDAAKETKEPRKEYRFITKSGQVKTTRRHCRLATHPRRGETVVEVAPRRHKSSGDKNKTSVHDPNKRPSLENANTNVDAYYSQQSPRASSFQPITGFPSHSRIGSQSQPVSGYFALPRVGRNQLESPFVDGRRFVESGGRGSAGESNSTVRSSPQSPDANFEREIDELEALLGWPKVGEIMTPADWIKESESASSRLSSSSPSSSSEIGNKAQSMKAMVGSQPVDGVYDEASRRQRNHVLGMAQTIAREAKQERKERRQHFMDDQKSGQERVRQSWPITSAYDGHRGYLTQQQQPPPNYQQPRPEPEHLEENHVSFNRQQQSSWIQNSVIDSPRNFQGGTPGQIIVDVRPPNLASPSTFQEESFYL